MTRRREPRRQKAAPVPLGSVSQHGGALAPGAEACLGCGNTDLVRIRMGSPGGRELVFVSCPRCERKAWFAVDGDGTPLSSDEVTGGGPEPGR